MSDDITVGGHKMSKKIVTAVIVAMLATGWFIYAASHGVGSDYTSNGLPKCESKTAEADVQRAIGGSPGARLFGMQVIGIDSAVTVSESATGRTCHAMASLNSGQTMPVDYTYTIRADHKTYYIAASLGY